MEDVALKEIDETLIEPNFLSRASDRLREAFPDSSNIPDRTRVEFTFLWMRLTGPLSDDSTLRFLPTIIRGDPQQEASAIWSNIKQDQWLWMEKRSVSTLNPALKAHYNDIFWETRRIHRLPKPFGFAERAVDGYLKWLEAGASSSKFWQDLNSIARRIAELGLTLGRPEWVQLAFDRLIGLLKTFEAEGIKKPGIVLRLADSILDVLDNAKRRFPSFTADELQATKDIIERFCSHHKHPLSGNLLRHAEQLLGRIDAHQGTSSPDRRRAVANSFMMQADFHMQHGNPIAASSFFMQAVEAYTALGDSASAALAKKKTREANTESLSQMSEYRVVFSAPTEFMEDTLKSLLEPEALSNIIERCRTSDVLVPDLGLAQPKAEEGVRLSDIVSSVTLSGNRQIAKDQTGKEAEQARERILRIQTSAQFIWLPFLERARQRGLTPETLGDIVKERGLIPDGHETSIRRGLQRFFEEDFISALHILTPQFEASFRHRLAALGIDITAYRSIQGGRLQERTMSVFFDEEQSPELSQETKTKLGDRFWMWMKFVFVDERGLNIRNNIAHGLMTDENLDRIRASLVVLAFIRLLPTK